jgi:hypothetical protein
MESLDYLVVTVSAKRFISFTRVKMVKGSVLHDNILAYTTRGDFGRTKFVASNLYHVYVNPI